MTKYEEMTALRSNPAVPCNCAQAVLIPFAEELGITREQAKAVATHFSGGMGCGSVCGAVTGALMAMGGLGIPEEQRLTLLERFRAAHGTLNCSELVQGLVPGTPERKRTCDGFVGECLNFVCQLTGKE